MAFNLKKMNQYKPRKFKLTREEYRNEFLKSEEWKMLRSSFLKTKDGKCERCNNAGNDVHHLEYKFLSSHDKQIKRLMLLCRNCHQLTHKAIDCGLLKFPHHKNQVIDLTEDKIKKKFSYLRKKHLISMMLISEIIKGTYHGVKMSCGILKITESTFRSIPTNLKATQDQINHLEWIAKTKPLAFKTKKPERNFFQSGF